MQSQYPVVEAVLIGTRAIQRPSDSAYYLCRNPRARRTHTCNAWLYPVGTENLRVFELRQAEGIRDFLVQRDPQAVRLGQEHFDNTRVELPAREAANFIAGSGYRQCFAIRPVGNHGVESVRHREYSRAQRNLLAAQPAWIARSVIALLVRENDLGSLLQKRNALQHSKADVAVPSHDFTLFRR